MLPPETLTSTAGNPAPRLDAKAALARLSSGVRGVALFVTLLVACACSVPVAGGLEETNANRIVVALEEQGVVADKERDPESEGRYRVLVARDDASTAISVLTRENLPAPDTPSVLDSLGQGGLVPSRSSEQARLIAGTAGELERSLREVDGVLSARVHLAVMGRDPLQTDDQTHKPTASVLIRYRGATPPIASDEVKRLVAGAVPELEPDQVAVVSSSVPEPAPAAERELARFGPVTATRSSMLPLRLGVGIAVVANLLLLGLLLFLTSRLRQLRADLESIRHADGRQSAE
ncbi:MAG: hypothetical protein KC766_28540 [Myxococcales bacterium]|nr:hypothetical protein [Myxococcales bacterium]